MTYHLELSPKLSRIHNIFHISMLRKYIPDPSHILEALPIELEEDLSFEVQPKCHYGSRNETAKE